MAIQPMTEEEWNKKWPMSKIPDSIREVALAWSGHLFIRDKVKFAQDLLEATEKYRLEYASMQSVAFLKWLRTNAYYDGDEWLYQDMYLTESHLYNKFIESQNKTPRQ